MREEEGVKEEELNRRSKKREGSSGQSVGSDNPYFLMAASQPTCFVMDTLQSLSCVRG